jgi:hypothetical protein
MARFGKGVKALKRIDAALDKGMARFLIGTQSKLSAASPVDTGRLASNWFVGENRPERKETGVEPWASKKPGDSPIIQVEQPTMKITAADGTWYISNNLPYAFRAAYDPYSGRVGAGAWFTSIANNLGKDAQEAFDFYLKKLK